MIRYNLKCANDHSFESWFQSAEAFDKLAKAKMVSCPTCGGTDVQKSIMAPSIGKKSNTQSDTTLTTQSTEQEQVISAMRKHVEENSEDVGEKFASEARAMHVGDAPERAIHGQAKPDEARALLEDGVPVLPLPFDPKRKAN